jgi:hypothetical protein
VPFPDKVKARFANWVAQQENSGRKFTAEQMRWLEMIRDHVATSVEITPDVFGYTPFAEQGGLGKAAQLFGKALRPLLDELNEALAAAQVQPKSGNCSFVHCRIPRAVNCRSVASVRARTLVFRVRDFCLLACHLR